VRQIDDVEQAEDDRQAERDRAMIKPQINPFIASSSSLSMAGDRRRMAISGGKHRLAGRKSQYSSRAGVSPSLSCW